MVLPEPVDPQIGPRQPFPLEADALQQPDRRTIMRQTGRLDSVQTQGGEGIARHRPDRSRHQSLARVGHAHPVAKRRRLGDTALDLPERQTADELLVLIAKDEKGIGLVVRHFLQIAA